MKKLFVALSLILGFSAAQALDGTLKIQSYVNHPQTGQTITIDFGNYVFDVFRDRRELVREVYNICKNPPEKIKTFIANRRNLGNRSVTIYFNNPNGKYSYSMLDCQYSDGKLSSVGLKFIHDDTTLNDIINQNMQNFSTQFAIFIDTARAEAKEKGISITLPNKTIGIKFGSQTINPETCAEGIATYPSLDYEFNVYDDRRELIKKVWESCTNLQPNILKEIKNGNTSPSVSVWYEHPQGGLDELKSLKCFFSRNTGELYSVAGFNKNNRSIEQAIENGAKNKDAINDFIKLIDVTNTSSKGSQKSNTKAKK